MNKRSLFIYLLVLVFFVGVESRGDEMEKHQPPIKGIARDEQPIFTGYMKSYRSESSSMDQLIGDINNDGILDIILLPNAFSSIELPSARNISSYLGEPGGSIKIDPVTTELESPIFRTQGVLGNFIEDSPNMDLAIAGLKANLYAAIKWKNNYVYTLTSEGANFQIFNYVDDEIFVPKSEVMLGDFAVSGSLDINDANTIAVAAVTKSLLFIDISVKEIPVVKSSISPKKRDFTHVRINSTSAYALDSIHQLLSTASTLLRVFDITNVDNPVEIIKPIELAGYAKSLYIDPSTSIISVGTFTQDVAQGKVYVINDLLNPDPVNIQFDGEVITGVFNTANRLYVASFDPSALNNFLRIYNIEDPNNPLLLNESLISVIPSFLEIHTHYAYISSEENKQLLMIDMADDEIVEICSTDFPGQVHENDVELLGMRSFVAANGAGIYAIDISLNVFCSHDPGKYIARHQTANVINIYQGDGSGHFQLHNIIPLDGKRLGSVPSDITVGYFDNNNMLDIVIADFGLRKIYVLFGYGDGTFLIKEVPDLIINNPVKLIVDDINSDGYYDIIYISSNILPFYIGQSRLYPSMTAYMQDTDLHLLLGKEEGNFESDQVTPIVNDPEDFAAGYINQDNKLDVGVIDTDIGTVELYVYDENYVYPFKKINNFELIYPTAIALSNFNNDDKTETVIAAQKEENTREIDIVIHSDLEGATGPVELYRQPISQIAVLDIYSEDINNDDQPDLLFSYAVPAGVSLMQNIYESNLGSSVRFNNLPLWAQGKSDSYKIASADIDADGFADIGAFNYNKKFEFFKNTGYAFLSVSENSIETEYVIDMELIQFDEDELVDLLLLNQESGIYQLVLERGNGDGTFDVVQSLSLPSLPQDIEKIDFDNDGDYDTAILLNPTLNPPFENIWMIENKRNGQLNKISPAPLFNYFTISNEIARGYFNPEDEIPDLAFGVQQMASNIEPGQFFIIFLKGTGGGTFEEYAAIPVAIGPENITAGDFNGDHLSDIAYCSLFGTEVNIRYNVNGNFPPEDDTTLFAFVPFKLRSFDINMDNFDDIIVMEEYILSSGWDTQPASIAVFLSKGDGSFRKDSDYIACNDPDDISISDLNNDGRLDIAVTGFSSFIANDPQAITILYNHFPFPTVEDSEPAVICTPVYNESIAIKGINFQNPEVFVNNYAINIVDVSPDMIQGAVTVPEKVAGDTYIKVINHIYDDVFEDVLDNAVTFGIKVGIDSISPVSIPVTGEVDIYVTGEGFFAGQTKVVLEGELSDGTQWIYEPPFWIESENSIRFIAPHSPEPPQEGAYKSTIVTVCVENAHCGRKCLVEALGYYNETSGDYAFTPHIGTTSGSTPITFYVPNTPLPKFCQVKIDDITAPIAYNQDGKIITYSQAHHFASTGVGVKLCLCTSLTTCISLPHAYQYSTFSYLTGISEHIEVLDTDNDELVDFHPYQSGIQSRIELRKPARTSSFSIRSKNIDYRIPGRYAFVIMGESIAKIDTGSNEIIAVSPPFLPPRPLTRIYYKDVDIALLGESNIVVVASDELADFPLSQGGIVTFDATELEVIDYELIPELPNGSTINLRMLNNTAYITALSSSDGPPYMQAVVRATIDKVTGQIYNIEVSYPGTPYQITDLTDIYQIGSDILNQSCGGPGQSYSCVYYVAPEANELDVMNYGSCNCPFPNMSVYLSSPQDVAVGYIYEPTKDIYEWKAFVVNATLDDADQQRNKWTRVNDLLNFPLANNAESTHGSTPVACKLRRSDNIAYDYDKVYIVNMDSVDALDESDVTVVWSDRNIIKREIIGISEEFKSRTIAIQRVLSTINMLEATRTTIELMSNEDFTTASKQQVLLNKLDAIENLLQTPANEQAVISNTEAFQNQVDNFVVNEVRKEELIAYSSALIKAVEQQ